MQACWHGSICKHCLEMPSSHWRQLAFELYRIKPTQLLCRFADLHENSHAFVHMFNHSLFCTKINCFLSTYFIFSHKATAVEIQVASLYGPYCLIFSPGMEVALYRQVCIWVSTEEENPEFSILSHLLATIEYLPLRVLYWTASIINVNIWICCTMGQVQDWY